ncbi:LOW QUALITY PROTEIN: large subunit GTPase 1 homolog [Erythrolamprus reginae]|uniref:LOW QUALITY PROTEIN: large subunit GTPase 1 homolog n=1 Tax=Erythrolamprus reginae TaxID=121349 RepID=UPI00396CAB13
MPVARQRGGPKPPREGPGGAGARPALLAVSSPGMAAVPEEASPSGRDGAERLLASAEPSEEPPPARLEGAPPLARLACRSQLPPSPGGAAARSSSRRSVARLGHFLTLRLGLRGALLPRVLGRTLGFSLKGGIAKGLPALSLGWRIGDQALMGVPRLFPGFCPPIPRRMAGGVFGAARGRERRRPRPGLEATAALPPLGRFRQKEPSGVSRLPAPVPWRGDPALVSALFASAPRGNEKERRHFSAPVRPPPLPELPAPTTCPKASGRRWERSRRRGWAAPSVAGAGRAGRDGATRASWASRAAAPPAQSVTEQSPLEAFLAAAELAGAAFAAEKLNVRLAPGCGAAEEAGRSAAEEEEERLLRIPRRPPWDERTSPAALNQAERDSFLKWRRKLAWLEEEENLLLTPFERNLDFWRQLWRVLERSDVVVQIVDARNPLLFRCRDLECYARELSPEKETLLLLNKAELLGGEQRSAWARFFQREGVRVVFWSAVAEGHRLGASPEALVGAMEGAELEEQRPPPGPPPGDTEEEEEEEEEEDWLTCSEDGGEHEGPLAPLGGIGAEPSPPAPAPHGPPVRNSSRLVQREELLGILKALHAGRRKVREGELTVGLVGYPNVGKSSTINTILGKKVVSVSATPGRTKHFQTLFVEPGLCLCDCPGLVMPSFVSTKAEMVCSGILPIDQLRDHVPPVTLVCQRIPRPVLEATYGISLPRPREDQDPHRAPTSEELLSALGCMRGFMTDHGQPDQPRSARLVLKDFVTGKLLYCHPPPGMEAGLFQRGLERLRPGKGAATAQWNGEQPPPGRGPKAKQAQNPVDQAFFHQENVRALTRGNRVGLGCPAGTLAHPPSGPPLADGAGKPWKRHGNRNKKQKLRRLTGHLEA